MKLTYSILCFLLPVLAFCQKSGDRTAHYEVKWVDNQNASRLSSTIFTFCDTDSDGMMPIGLNAIKDQILNQNINQFGSDEGVYICTSQRKIHLITNLGGTPHKNLLCQGNWGNPSIGNGFLDIAVDDQGTIFVSGYNKIYKTDEGCDNLAVYNPYPFDGMNALSFDRENRMYVGGFDTSVHRMDPSNYGQMALWHDFGDGYAAGDFVMCKDKMYIAWNINDQCRLYEVTVDGNTNYVSHIDLGNLPMNTYGLASELGKLYGVTTSQLYKINLDSTLTFAPILTNTNAGDAWYGAAGKHEAFDLKVDVFSSVQDAQNNVNPLPDTWTNTIAAQTVYVAIRNLSDGQLVVVPVQLVINAAPTFSNPQRITHCESDANCNDFNIRDTETQIKAGQSNVTVSYHQSAGDATNDANPLPDVYTTDGTPTNVYVRIENDLTGCFATFDFVLEVLPKPVFHQPKDLIVCAENAAWVNFEIQIPQILNGQNTQNIQVTFHQTHSEAAARINPLAVPHPMNIGQQEIFVRLTNAYSNCYDTGSFLVKVRNENTDFPLHYNVEIQDWTYDENSISVIASGNYEYSLDGIAYQDSPYSGNLSAGEYQLHVRDKDNCSVSIKDVFLLMYPKFFTPNGDGFHDQWTIVSAASQPGMKIEIFDRYGKMIVGLSAQNPKWDGTFNGKSLPSSDYWFIVTRQDGKEFKGHFTLKR